MKEYKIVYEPIYDNEGSIVNKWNIYYYDGDSEPYKEFYKNDKMSCEIKEGYFKHKDSL